MSSAVLRAYRTEDFEQLVDLFLLNTPQYFCPEEQSDLEEYLRTEIEYYFVMEEDGQILACGGCNVEDGIGWLSWYIVHPFHHGKGLGATIVKHCLEILMRNEEVNEIEVRTSQLVYPFYEKFGFVLYNTEDDYWGKGMHLYQMKLKHKAIS